MSYDNIDDEYELPDGAPSSMEDVQSRRLRLLVDQWEYVDRLERVARAVVEYGKGPTGHPAEEVLHALACATSAMPYPPTEVNSAEFSDVRASSWRWRHRAEASRAAGRARLAACVLCGRRPSSP